MRPLTMTKPKPLMPVAGRTLLDRALDGLAQDGVRDVVVNTHHLAEQIENHVRLYQHPPTLPPQGGGDTGGGGPQMRIHLSYESTLLDTGGGIQKMLQHFGNDPFYVLSGDGLWTGDALGALAAAWDPRRMDILMLLQPLSTFTLTQGVGDYDLLQDGRAMRSKDKSGAYMFTSMRINHPRIFAGAPEGAWSYLKLMDEAEKAGRLYGVVHAGEWHHISTPADLLAVDRVFTREQK